MRIVIGALCALAFLVLAIFFALQIRAKSRELSGKPDRIGRVRSVRDQLEQ